MPQTESLRHDLSETAELLGSIRGPDGRELNVTSYGATPAAEPAERDARRSWRYILLPCIAMWTVTFIVSVDATIVAMLLGVISSAFHSSEQASAIGTSFLVCVCCTSPLYGRLCDIVGRKRSLTIALTLFTFGTFLCASARSMNEFLLARTLAGIGGGGLSTITSVIMSHLVPLKSRGMYQGLTNLVYGAGVGLGAPLGGLLNDSIGWRGAFYAQLPFLLLSLAALYLLLEHDESLHFSAEEPLWRRLREVDLLGLVVYSCVPILSVRVLELFSVQMRELSDPSVLVCVGGIVAALVVFFLIERRARMPIMSTKVLSLRSGWASLYANFCLSIGVFAFSYNFPLYLQTVAQMLPSSVGARMVPASLCIGIGSFSAGLYMRHRGRYYKYNLACSLLMLVACVPSAWYLTNPSTVWPFVFTVPMTFGHAGVLTCTLISLIHVVDKPSISVATGMSYQFRTLGQLLGVAVSGVLLQLVLARELRDRILGPGAEELISQIRHESTIIALLPDGLRQEAIAAYAWAIHAVFLFVIACFSVMALCSAWIEDKPLNDEHVQHEQPRE